MLPGYNSSFKIVIIIIATVTTVLNIQPKCFNCHCSTYFLDSTITCKNATYAKSYFSLQTKNVTAIEGSDVMLSVQLKEPHSDYCWCTDALLEWNLLYQNSSGRLLYILLKNATKVDTGHFWAVLYIQEKFYFSNAVYLNVTGPIEPIHLPDLEPNPKMSALIVAILAVTIMVMGISIYCWKMHKKRRLISKQRKHLRDLENVNDRTPLKWKIQPPQYESENEIVYGPQPLPSDVDENGAPSSESDEEEARVKDRSATFTISSGSENEEELRPKTSLSRRPTPSPVRDIRPSPLTPRNSPAPIIVAQVPVTGSTYKSLNTEVQSAPLLTDPNREKKREEKKRLKSLQKSSTENIASGILKSGDAASLFGNGILPREQMEHLHKIYNAMNRDFRYGRSLPTPQPAGARPTVMTLFPIISGTSSSTIAMRSTATIHTTRPNKHKRVASLFRDLDEIGRSGSKVSFADEKPPTRRFGSAEDISTLATNAKLKFPKKSSLKSAKVPDIVEIDGNNNELPLESAPVEQVQRSSDSGNESETSDKKITPPQLKLDPATPTTAYPSRFTILKVPSVDGDLDEGDPLNSAFCRWLALLIDHQKYYVIEDSTLSPDVPSIPDVWDFAAAAAAAAAAASNESPLPSPDLRDKPMRRKMDHLTVPGIPPNLDGYWSS